MNFGNRWCADVARHERGRADIYSGAVWRAVMATKAGVTTPPAGSAHTPRAAVEILM